MSIKKETKQEEQDDFQPLPEKYYLKNHLTGTREDAKFWASIPSRFGNELRYKNDPPKG